MKPLTVIPVYATKGQDVEMLDDCLDSLRRTTGEATDVWVIDDASPDEDLAAAVSALALRYDGTYMRQEENGGFSRTVNVGLRHARDNGRDAILVNSDIQFLKPGWLELMQQQECLASGGLASVVGGMLQFGQGIIQHGGIYFSLLTRSFDHFWKFAPVNLPAAQIAKTLPVTAALQFIRHEALTTVGVYDERFRMGFEDVDYCIRTFLAGRECVYQPKVRAIHHESMFRGNASDKVKRWEHESLIALFVKYADQNFSALVPFQ